MKTNKLKEEKCDCERCTNLICNPPSICAAGCVVGPFDVKSLPCGRQSVCPSGLELRIKNN
jgi:hypothetical protein